MKSADWSELPEELLLRIYERLNKFFDQVRFSQVCKSWRSASHLPQPPLMLMLHNLILTQPSTSTSTSTRTSSLSSEFHKKRIVGSMGNWVITVDTEETIRLTNPFSAAEIFLPPQYTFKSRTGEIFVPPHYMSRISCYADYRLSIIDKRWWTPEQRRDCFLSKVVLSSSPSSYSEVIAMAISNCNKVAIASPGDRVWKILKPTRPYRYSLALQDAIFYKGKFYVVEYGGVLFECDINNNIRRPRLRKLKLYIHSCPKFYLVELMGELCLVLRFWKREGNYRETNKFEVYKANFALKRWVAVKSLGSHSLFVGLNTSVSASSGLAAFEKNCIYFTNDSNRFDSLNLYDMGVYSLEHDRIEAIYPYTSSLSYESIWIIPRSITNSLCMDSRGTLILAYHLD